MRLRLDLSYDGTHFHGWAAQPNLRTVQQTLEDAVAKVLGSPIRLVVAGRTDAGVHATGQVAHFDATTEQALRISGWRPTASLSEHELLAGKVRGVLGAYADVSVSKTTLAPAGFDARFSAVWRQYRYRIADGLSPYNPLQRHNTVRTRTVLDEQAMNQAAASLLGLHDFAAYCKPREGATTIRTLLDYRWQRQDDGVLVAEVRADAFCHSMVRALVGACVAVGEGKRAVADVEVLRDAGQRTSAFTVYPARGLTLTEVGYPDDSLLAVRAEQTRARRQS